MTTAPTAAPAADTLLVSLAILRANWENGASYLDNFVPFALDAIRADGGASFTSCDVADLVLARFALRVPDGVMTTLLSKAVKDGSLLRLPHKRFAPEPARLAQAPDVAREQAKWKRQMAALIESLQAFSSVRHGLALGFDDAERALLAHVERHAVPLLAATVRGVGYGGAADDGDALDYIVSSFIADIDVNDQQAVEQLEAVVKGSMLASVLYLPNASEVGRRFDKTTLYLDTPVLLRALGYEGDTSARAARQMLLLAREFRGRLACFEHTVKEIRGVLTGAAIAIGRQGAEPSPNRGVEAHLLAQGLGRSDVELMLDSLEDDLRELGVRVVATPVHAIAQTIDEEALERQLDERVHYQNASTRRRDVSSLAAVHRLRDGECPPRLETARAVFITDNDKVVHVAREFFTDGSEGCPVALLDHDLATLLWLKRPTAAPDLPRQQILADCYAALQPGDALWAQYLAQVERLRERGGISERDLVVLRYSPEARRALMDRTLGRPDGVTQKVITDVLDTARRGVAAPAEAERDRAVAERDAAARGRDALQSAVDGDRRDLVALRGEVARLHETHHRARSRIEARSRRIARWLRWLLSTLLLAVITAGVLATLHLIGSTWPAALKVGVNVGVPVLVVLSGVALWNGFNVKDWSHRVEERFAVWHQRRALYRFGLDATENEAPQPSA